MEELYQKTEEEMISYANLAVDAKKVIEDILDVVYSNDPSDKKLKDIGNKCRDILNNFMEGKV